MEEYRARTAPRKPAMTLGRLLARNRSCRGYDAGFIVREDQLRTLIEVNAAVPSARNQQVLRFRPVLADEAPRVLACVRMGGALPDLHLPLPGTEPNAFIIVCSTVPEDRYVDIDLGIAVQSMLLRAVEIGLNGLCIGAFDRERIRRPAAESLHYSHPPRILAPLRAAAYRGGRPEHRADRTGPNRRRGGPDLLPAGRCALCPENKTGGAYS